MVFKKKNNQSSTFFLINDNELEWEPSAAQVTKIYSAVYPH